MTVIGIRCIQQIIPFYYSVIGFIFTLHSNITNIVFVEYIIKVGKDELILNTCLSESRMKILQKLSLTLSKVERYSMENSVEAVRQITLNVMA